ncbi:MAG TPA: SDR family oxidoreductase [Candidatus Saccharimonadales bacterium]|nr:SDR family oxidoreductase [Candidatus Saccharimonadales bacterium]
MIVGGSAGLGLALAERLQTDYRVTVTGRSDPNIAGVMFQKLDLTGTNGLSDRIRQVVEAVGQIDLLIYSAGFFQEGTITDLSEAQMYEMLNVCLIGALDITREILLQQGELAEFIAITSTSQYTPRKLEPLYTVAKAGLGMYANSLSLDERVGKTLVAGPAGMKTKFHAGRTEDMSTYLDPEWAADQIMAIRSEAYRYKYVRILRDPAHIEVQETRA